MAIQTIDRFLVEQAHFKAVKRLERASDFEGEVSTKVSLRPDKGNFESYTVTSGDGLFRMDYSRGIPTNILEIPAEYYFGVN